MTTIESNNKICTLINVFTVEPERQSELFENLKEASEKIFSKMPGYISANIHMGDDGKTITNYAQWASLEDSKNVVANHEVMHHMQKAAAIAKEFKPVTYHTVWAHSNND